MTSVTSRQLPTEGPAAGGGDEFDDLDDYDAGLDPFSDNYVLPGAKEREAAAKAREQESTKQGKSGAGLGIDEEIDTRKPRAPRVKLDEHRLLSAAGIPKLRKRAANHLKFKGKGHEYSDCSKLLAFYQLWLDDLFPKARFLDALAMVEKMGHKRQLQSARMEWINEGKPRSSEHEDSLFDQPAPAPNENCDNTNAAPRIAPIFEKTTERPKTPETNAGADADDRHKPADAAPQTTSLFGEGGPSLFGKTAAADDIPDDDDLEALLADEELSAASKTTQPTVRKPVTIQGDDFYDDMDALLTEEELQIARKPNQLAIAQNKPVTIQEDDFDDDLEAMAEMGW